MPHVWTHLEATSVLAWKVLVEMAEHVQVSDADSLSNYDKNFNMYVTTH